MAWFGVASAMFYVYVGAAMALAYGTLNGLFPVERGGVVSQGARALA